MVIYYEAWSIQNRYKEAEKLPLRIRRHPRDEYSVSLKLSSENMNKDCSKVESRNVVKLQDPKSGSNCK